VSPDEARSAIGARFSGAEVGAGTPMTTGVSVTVTPDRWAELAQFAKETLGCRFFSFLSAVDWKEQGLEVVAKVDNLDDGLAVMLKTRLGPGVSTCASLTPIYRGANWMERECWDMFGIRFDGHPDLRRILLEDTWEGHPLLKSYAVDTPHPPYR
jgi:NADH-quinone oxidoreductase subunit C